MPEPWAAPFPPMAPLHGAVPGWLPQDWLCSVSTPEGARAALRAESETSVLDPVGMRRLWLRELALAAAVAGLLLMVVAGVQLIRNGEPPAWMWAVLLLYPILSLGSAFGAAAFRAVPAAGAVPRFGPARWRWHRQLRREPVVVRPPAAWPAGSEAYAVLAAAGSVETVAPSWLFERVGLSPAVGDQWVGVLARQRWLSGGGHLLGIERLPEAHLRLTETGRQALEAERTRLQALAAT